MYRVYQGFWCGIVISKCVNTAFAHLFLSFLGRLPKSMPTLKLYCARISSPQRSGLFFIGNVNVIKAPKQLLGGTTFRKQWPVLVLCSVLAEKRSV